MTMEEDNRRDIVEHLVDVFQQTGDPDTLRGVIRDSHPVDIATALDDLEDGQRQSILGLMEPEQLAEVLEEADEDGVGDFVEAASAESLAAVVEEMSPDAAADILDLVDDSKARQVLARLSPDHAEDVQQLRVYDSETAGGIMTNEFFSVLPQQTVGDVIAVIRKDSEEIESFSDIAVCSESGKLCGVVTAEDLISSQDNVAMRDLMEPAAITVGPYADQELCARYMSKYDLRILPVVGPDRLLLGIITVDDIIDVMDEEASEDMYRLAGVGADRPLEENVFARAWKRLPWLATTLLGTGFLGPLIIQGCFDSTIKKMTALLLFVPVVMAIGGNTGMQSSTITVRGLATGEVVFKDLFWMLRREMGVALVMALTCCTVISLCACALFALGMEVEAPPLLFILTVSGAMFVGISGSVLVGTLIPMLCARFGIDPAVAAGPFITTLTDISTQALYLALATLLLIK